MVEALKLAGRLGAEKVDLFLDSKLIVEQLHGRWRVKDAKLAPLHATAKGLLGGFRRWSATHVPRAQNSQADRLANEALDRVAAGGTGTGGPRAAVRPDEAPTGPVGRARGDPRDLGQGTRPNRPGVVPRNA